MRCNRDKISVLLIYLFFLAKSVVLLSSYVTTRLNGTVSAKIAPRLKCYKNASRLNRYNFPTDNAMDFLFSTLHSDMV